MTFRGMSATRWRMGHTNWPKSSKTESIEVRKLRADGYEQVLQGFENAKKYLEDGKSRLERLIQTA